MRPPSCTISRYVVDFLRPNGHVEPGVENAGKGCDADSCCGRSGRRRAVSNRTRERCPTAICRKTAWRTGQ